MTMLIKMGRMEAARKVAESRKTLVGNSVPHHTSMIDAIEIVDALEVLGVIRFDEATAKEPTR